MQNLTFTTNESNNTTENSQVVIIWPNVLNSLICLTGLVTVSINIAVFANRTLTDKSYSLLLTEAIADLIYLAFSLIWPAFHYAIQSNTIISALYSIAIDDYLTSCLAIYSVLVELFLSVDRLLILSNQTMLVNIKLNYLIAGLILIALIMYLPVLLLKRIDCNDSRVLVATSLGQTEFGIIIPTILSVIRVFLVVVCLFLINLVTLVKFKQYLGKKSHMVNNNKQNRTEASLINLPSKYLYY